MKNTMIAVLLISAALISAGPAATVPVEILDSSFGPESLFVAPGDTVVWTNNGVFPHTSTSGVNGSPDGIWDSGTLAGGQSFSHVFADEGDYPYYCTFHYLGGMTGNVTVSASGVEERTEAVGPGLATTVARGSVRMSGSALLVDPSGQAVARLVSGRNDISALSPGLYFLLPVDPVAAPSRLIAVR